MLSFEYPILISSITVDVRYASEQIQIDYRSDGNVWESTNWRRLSDNSSILQKIKPNISEPPYRISYRRFE